MKVECEYCGSIVDVQTNCPNCGAVLQIGRDQECRLVYNETYTFRRKEWWDEACKVIEEKLRDSVHRTIMGV